MEPIVPDIKEYDMKLKQLCLSVVWLSCASVALLVCGANAFVVAQDGNSPLMLVGTIAEMSDDDIIVSALNDPKFTRTLTTTSETEIRGKDTLEMSDLAKGMTIIAIERSIDGKRVASRITVVKGIRNP